MQKVNNDAREQLIELEKLVKKVIRKSLKDNTLDYTVQITVSSLEPSKVKYAAQISSPSNGVQPITFIFDNFNDLKNSLEESEKEINREKIELTFHQSRVNTYETKIQQHKARILQIEKGDTEAEDDNENIPMEEV